MWEYVIIAIIIVIAIGAGVLYATRKAAVVLATGLAAPPAASSAPPVAPPAVHAQPAVKTTTPPAPKYTGPLTKAQIAEAGIGRDEVVRCAKDGAIAKITRGYRMPYKTMAAWEGDGRPAYRNIPCDLFYAIPESDYAAGPAMGTIVAA